MTTEPNIPLPPVAATNATPSADAALLADAPVQTHKLDADLFIAGDIDGVTESLFGSGNLNYLLLQARQTDAAGTGNGFDGMDAAQADPYAPSWLLAAAKNITGTAQGMDSDDALFAANPADASGAADSSNFGGNEAFRALAGNGDGTGGFGNVARMMDSPPADAPPSDDGDDTTDDNDDSDDDDDGDDDGGDDGGDDDDGGGDDGGGDDGGGGNNGGDIDILGDNNIGLPVVDINLDPLENIVGDIDLGVGIGFDPDDGLTIDLDTVLVDIPILDGAINIDIPLLNPVIAEVLNIADPVLDIVTDITQPLLDGVATTAESLLGSLLGAPPPTDGDYDLQVHTDLGIPNLDVNLDVIENIVGDIDIGVTLDALGGDSIGLGIETIVADLPLANIGADLGVPVIMPVVNGALAPAADMLGDITAPETLAGIFENPAEAIPDILETAVEGVADTVSGAVSGLEDTLENTLASLGQTDNSAGDADLAVHNNIGLPQIDVNLDTVESITGDIDLGLSATNGEDGLTLGLDTTVAGINLLEDVNVTVDIPLVTPVISDVLDVAQGLLGEAASDEGTAHGAMALLDETAQGLEDVLSGILGSGADGGGDAAWPQLDAGALLGSEGIGGIIGGGDDGALHLPEPVGNIVEGLGLLPAGSEHGGGLLSGLFNGHGGGLFG